MSKNYLKGSAKLYYQESTLILLEFLYQRYGCPDTTTRFYRIFDFFGVKDLYNV